jgi:hypothetical protein
LQLPATAIIRSTNLRQRKSGAAIRGRSRLAFVPH